MYKIGDRVINHRFGIGTVIGTCAHLFYIRFDSGTYSNESAHYLKPAPRG